MFKGLGPFLCMTLVACGGGSGFSGSGSSENVALASNGGIAGANSNDGAAAHVIDGNRGTTNYWNGSSGGKNVSVMFSQTAEIEKISVYSNVGEISESNRQLDVHLYMGGFKAITPSICSSVSNSGGRYSCTLSTPAMADYVFVTTYDSSVRIYEIEAYATEDEN